ncbi:MAG: GAF domain-containing protein [Deltaproteobacteria bacterium]|nr:GAF domain-containing protein [Deltaproteobacteria bacterium]
MSTVSEAVRKLAALNQAARAMNSILDPDQLLDTILSLVEDVFRLDTCALLLFDSEEGVLTIRAARGYRPEVVAGFKASIGVGITGEAFRSGDPVIVNDVRQYEGYIQGVQGARSEMAVPLRIDDEIIGVLDAESRKPGAFHLDDLDLFRIFANQAATAINNARLVASIKDRSQRLERRVQDLELLGRLGRQVSSSLSLDELLDEILSLGKKALHFDNCALLERVGDDLVVRAALGYKDEVHAGMRIPTGRGITGRVLATGKAVLVPDVQINGGYIEGVAGGRCEMATPLIVRDEVVGVLDAEAKEPDAFSEQDLRLFSTFASWAAQALHNADIHSRLEKKQAQLAEHVREIDRMNEELKDHAKRIKKANVNLEKRVRELETLQKASRTITSSLDLDRTLDAIVGMTKEIVDSSSCAIRLLDQESLGNEELLAKSPEAAPETKPAGVAWLKNGEQAKLAVPLKIGDRIIGYFELSTGRDEAFSKDDERVLQVLASQAAIAIENARLFESTQQTYLETMKSLAQALEARDTYTKGHSERVTRYAVAIAKKMDLDARTQRVIHYAGMLHDIGKIGISDAILQKRVKLSEDEWETIRNHPLLGDNILGPIKFLSDAQKVVLRHHERYDGSGYPGRLKGEEIPLEARIIAVADSFDAMTSDRPYRKALSRDVAVAEIKNTSGSQFDPRVVEAFLAIVEDVFAAT